MNSASFVGSFAGEAAVGVASLDPPLVQQTKSEIRTLASEIAKLAHSNMEPDAFYRGFLPRLTTAMGAEGAAVWQTQGSQRKFGVADASESNSDDLRLRLVAQVSLASELLDDQDDHQDNEGRTRTSPSESHRRILEAVIAEGTPILVPPQMVSIDVDRPTNPINHSIIVIPVRIEDEVEYLLEVVQPASGGPAAQRGYLRFVAQMADLMADFLRRQALREHTARVNRLQLFEYWLGTVAQEPPSRQLRSLASALAELLDCEQVLIVRSGRRPKVLSASGLESFDPRSETILAAEVAERFLQRVPEATSDCLDLGRWKAGEEHIASVGKLYELLAAASLYRLKCKENDGLVAYLVRDKSSQPSPAEMLRVASSLFNLVDVHATGLGWFQRWWPFKSAFRSRSVKSQRSTWRVWAIRVVCGMVVAAVGLFPVPQQITTTAVLSPSKKNCYYAPSDATVARVMDSARGNALVKKGDILLVLESAALNQRSNALAAELELNRKRLESLVNSIGGQSSTNFRNLDTEIEQTKLKILTNEREEELLNQELSKLTIYALENGELTTWDVANRLQGRPVIRGELLLSTCDPDSEWELQVSVPEHRVGLVSDALVHSRSQTVPIRFTLTSHPNVALQGNLTQLADQASRNASGSNVVLSRAAVSGELPIKKEGAVARVTIECGKVPAIWLVVRDAYWACMSRLNMIW